MTLTNKDGQRLVLDIEPRLASTEKLCEVVSNVKKALRDDFKRKNVDSSLQESAERLAKAHW